MYSPPPSMSTAYTPLYAYVHIRKNILTFTVPGDPCHLLRWTDQELSIFLLRDEETEAQRKLMNCPRSYS